MELIINNIPYTLKKFNTERRAFYVQNILSQNKIIYSNQSDQASKDIAAKKQVESIIDLVWLFLNPQDKKELKNKSLLKIESDEYAKFLKNLNKKLQEYLEYLKSENSFNESNIKQDVNEIYAFLSNQYGWTFDYIEEMDELEMLKAIKEAIKIRKQNELNKINRNALIAAFGAGSKKAKKAIDDLNREAKQEERFEVMKQQPAKRNSPLMSPEKMKEAISVRRS
jgi:accessory colonization factor AcfC